jgi:hypothetical protein
MSSKKNKKSSPALQVACPPGPEGDQMMLDNIARGTIFFLKGLKGTLAKFNDVSVVPVAVPGSSPLMLRCGKSWLMLMCCVADA